MNIVFDYCDLIYNNENPMNYILKKEFFHFLRKSFYMLNDTERFIIDEIIFKEKSIINTALIMDLDEKEVSNKLNLSLEVIYRLFQNMYL